MCCNYMFIIGTEIPIAIILCKQFYNQTFPINNLIHKNLVLRCLWSLSFETVRTLVFRVCMLYIYRSIKSICVKNGHIF